MKFIKQLRQTISTRIGFYWLLVVLFCAKTIAAYFIDFQLGISSIFEYIIAFISPIATTMFIFGLALYVKKARFFYPLILILDVLNTVLLYLNVIYFREFTDFMTISTITGYSKVNQGLSGSSLALTNPHDVIYWLDILVVLGLMLCRVIKIDKHPIKKKFSAMISSLSVFIFTLNLSLGEMDRPQLITRTFDRTYIVKYLGIDAFTVYDALQSQHTSDLRAMATKSELKNVLHFTRSHYAAPNRKMYGIAKHRNVIIIHLESFQQFLLDKKIDGQVVTPFLNHLYHSKSTFAFKNFFHQVGQGKTSDAENLLETSTFGLPQGSLFSQLGSDNTFQAAPAILEQKQHYTTAVFHGNVAGFWNRNNTYKNMGYQYFFDASYYDVSGDKSTEYGLKDKLLFNDSIKYLQNLQQPFYAKYITVTNHLPYLLDAEDSKFKTPNTDDQNVNNYFKTANYLDQSVHEFFRYLKKSGLLKHSMIVLYGDHYGIANSENPNLAPLLGKSSSSWNDFDNAQLQRVPLMINIPGEKHGHISKEYGGEVDVLPTIMHLLGINSKPYIQFGTDLFSPEHNQVVAFRDRDWVSPSYTSISGKIYSNKTGKPAKLNLNQQRKVGKMQQFVNQELSFSDTLNEQNLLRFYHPKGFKDINPNNFNYSDGLIKEQDIEKRLKNASTSLLSKRNGKTSTTLYKTNAPEVSHHSTNTNRLTINNQEEGKK